MKCEAGESVARVLFPLGVTFLSKFYNPNLHNIVKSDRIGFKTKTPNELMDLPNFVILVCDWLRLFLSTCQN